MVIAGNTRVTAPGGAVTGARTATSRRAPACPGERRSSTDSPRSVANGPRPTQNMASTARDGQQGHQSRPSRRVSQTGWPDSDLDRRPGPGRSRSSTAMTAAAGPALLAARKAAQGLRCRLLAVPLCAARLDFSIFWQSAYGTEGHRPSPTWRGRVRGARVVDGVPGWLGEPGEETGVGDGRPPGGGCRRPVLVNAIAAARFRASVSFDTGRFGIPRYAPYAALAALLAAVLAQREADAKPVASLLRRNRSPATAPARRPPRDGGVCWPCGRARYPLDGA